MTRIRLRPAWSEEELRGYCPEPHDHTHWPDHIVRVQDTIALGIELAGDHEVTSIADLACGDAAIPYGIAAALSPAQLFLGDFAPGYKITGMIEKTIHSIGKVDMFICSETVEHLDNPDQTLADIREHARLLVLSTPLSEFHAGNPQHYWGWDHEGVREMLEAAGWEAAIQQDVLHPLAQFQLWGCR